MSTVSRPPSARRILADAFRPVVRPARPPVVREEQNAVSLWICTAGGQRFAFTDLEAALAFRDEWNANRSHETPAPREAVVRIVTVSLAEAMHRARPGCRLVPLDLPADLFDTLAKRCAPLGIDVSQLVGELIDRHVRNIPAGPTGSGRVVNREELDPERDLQPAADHREGGVR